MGPVNLHAVEGRRSKIIQMIVKWARHLPQGRVSLGETQTEITGKPGQENLGVLNALTTQLISQNSGPDLTHFLRNT